MFDKIDYISAILVSVAEITPKVLGGIDGKRGGSFRTKWRTEEIVLAFSYSLTIIIGTHPLKNADRFYFIYRHNIFRL